MNEIVSLAILAVFPLAMIFATFYDLFTMTIPNKITFALVVGFAVLAPLAGISLETAMWHVGISLVVLLAGFAFFSFGVMGGGDAKLLAASALWFGAAATLPYLLTAGVLGGVLTILVMTCRSVLLPKSLLSVGWIMHLHDKDSGVPYGVALGPAALMVFMDTPWMTYISTGQPLG